MGLSESSLNIITKPFSFSSHCKVSCDSPCCTKIFGDEDHHCICNIDTHENVISDSDEEHIEKTIITLAEHSASISNNNLLRNIPQQVIIIFIYFA